VFQKNLQLTKLSTIYLPIEFPQIYPQNVLHSPVLRKKPGQTLPLNYLFESVKFAYSLSLFLPSKCQTRDKASGNKIERRDSFRPHQYLFDGKLLRIGRGKRKKDCPGV
jgi:hypothetical protein